MVLSPFSQWEKTATFQRALQKRAASMYDPNQQGNVNP